MTSDLGVGFLLGCLFTAALAIPLAVGFSTRATQDRICSTACGEFWVLQDDRCVCLTPEAP